MQKEYPNTDIKYPNSQKMTNEEDNFKSVFSSVFKQKEELIDNNQDNDLSFMDNISFDNSKNNTNTMTYNNINENNKLELYKYIREADEIEINEKNKDLFMLDSEDDKSIYLLNDTKSLMGFIKDVPTIILEDEYNKNSNNKKKRKSIRRNKRRNKIWIRGPYKKNNRILEKANIDDLCFPFTSGKGIIKTFNADIELKVNDDEVNGENSEMKGGVPNNNISGYFKISKLKKKKVKKQRKFKPDDIRKKIKLKFHKTLKNIINDNLKKAGSYEFLNFLPQTFLGNISKKFNYQYMNSTLEELLLIDFSQFKTKYINSQHDQNLYEDNSIVLKYLEENHEITKISGFDVIKSKKYKELLDSYFLSKEFEDTIEQLRKEHENDEYINTYIFLAKNYVNFFSNPNFN